MENFDKKIRDKLSSFDYSEAPNDSSVKSFFDGLDTLKSEDSKVKEFVPENKKSISKNLIFRIAASFLILIIGTYTTFQLNQVSVYASKGGKETIQLPDNSKVILNADSELSYNKILWNFERTVALKGEAFFEVTKGEKFEVTSEMGNTQVLGTSFNIYARDADYIVDCYTGKVRVNSEKDGKSSVLTPGKGVKILSKGKVRNYEFDVKRKKNWRQGAFYFDNADLQEVVNELSRQYNVEVFLPEKYQKIQYTGFFDNKNLEQSLKLICEPADLTYTIKGRDIIIK